VIEARTNRNGWFIGSGLLERRSISTRLYRCRPIPVLYSIDLA